MSEPPLSILLKTLGVFALVMANGFFVSAEFALVTVRRHRLKTLAEAGHKAAQAAVRLTEAPTIFISVSQFGVTVSSLAIGFLGEETIAHIFERWLAAVNFGAISARISAHTIAIPLAFALITFVHVVVGEIVPKTIALDRSEMVALLAARPIEWIHSLFRPFIWLLNNSGKKLARMLGIHSSLDHNNVYTEEEIRQLVLASYKQGHLIAEEKELIHNVFNFTNTVVCEVMAPRPEIVAVEASASSSELTKLLEASRYTRLPVYKENLDNIIGIIHAKDILPYLSRNEKVEMSKLMRKALFVPDSAQLVDVLRQMRRAQNQLAIVVDEHGGVEGIVTMEDLLEEIVGEIRDEHDHDEEEPFYAEDTDGTVVLDGALSIREANRKLSISLPESDGYTTLAGFLMAKAGKLLTQGEQIEYNSFIFRIEKLEGRRVSRIRFIRPINEDSIVNVTND